jgi:hypothetical protein
MKKVFWINPIIFTAILLLITCKKEKTSGDIIEYPHWPAVKTLVATKVDSTKATLNGTINAFGLSTIVIFEYGITTSYGDSVTAFQNPITGSNITNVSADISGLTPCTTYHFRVKAENSKWINFYGSDSTFITGHIPALTTSSILDITATTAISWGNINSSGCPITERGIYWWSSNMTDEHFYLKNDSTGAGSFRNNLTGLKPSTIYYVQSSARNCAGIALGNIISFTTPPIPEYTVPTAFINDVTNLNPTTATLNGAIDGYGLSTTVIFEYGTTTNYGKTVTPAQSPVTSNEFIDVRADIYGLIAGTTYHARVVAENSYGFTNGNDMEFTTPDQSAPMATTWRVTNLTSTTGTLNGSVNGLGLSTTVTFEYDTTSSIDDNQIIYGNTITANQSPVTSDGITNVSADISSLTPCAIYHFRVKAENSLGVLYGSDQHFYKARIPTVTTAAVYGITQTSAIVEGNILYDGGSEITERGFMWKLSSCPASPCTNWIKNDSTGVGRFTYNLSGLQPNTFYVVQSYAKSCLYSKVIGVNNWSRGNIISFTTLP